jgi:Phosphotransferase enzyme family
MRARVARRSLSIDRRDLPRILAAIGSVRPDAADWVVQDGRAGEPTILTIGPPGSQPAAIIRIARSLAGQRGLSRAAASLEQLHTRLEGADGDAMLPVPIGRGELEGRTWLVESALSGRSARTLLGDPDARRRMLRATIIAIGRIHDATAQPIVVDESVIDRWVTERGRIIAGALRHTLPRPAGGGRLPGVEAAISAELRGRTLVAGWIHGDLWPANVLVGGDEFVVSGFVDWDSAGKGELALHDRLHLALTTRRLVERKELGPVLIELLTGGDWTDDDRVVLGEHVEPIGDRDQEGAEIRSGLSMRTGLWLYWLRFVESNLARHPGLANDRAWMVSNVERVIGCA